MRNGKVLLTQEIYDRLVYIINIHHENFTIMAKKVGYTESYFFSLKIDHSYLQGAIIDKLVDVYGINKEAFITGDGELFDREINAIDDFPKRLKELKGNLSSSHVARAMKINPYKYIKFEKGEEVPTTKLMQRIADYFCVDIDWLRYGDEIAKENPINDEIIRFLKKNPELREIIWKEYK